jgi:hypothetical protein
MIDDDPLNRMGRAESAALAMRQWLAPAFDVCRADYLEKLADVAAKPMSDANRAGMEKLSLGVKVIDEVRSQIEAVIADGKVAAHSAEGASRLANMTTEQRRWLDYAPWRN